MSCTLDLTCNFNFMKQNEKLIIAGCIAMLIIEFFLVLDVPFFWDGTSKAHRAMWIFDNNFSSLIVPTYINSGHPPLWITLLAVFWSLLGKTLGTSRFLLLLVNIGVCYQLFSFSKKTLVAPIAFFLLLFMEPTLVAQTTILNNDMLLLFFVLLGLNSLLKNKWGWYTLALTGALLTNLRGIYTVIAFALIHIACIKVTGLENSKKMLRSYVIAVLAFCMFLLYQYSELGWVIITKSEKYASQRESVGGIFVLKNILSFGKNFLDVGRIFLWIPLIGLLVYGFKSKLKFDTSTKRIGIMFLGFTTIFFLGSVPFSNPIGPRYFMICYLLSMLFFINLMVLLQVSKKFRSILTTTVAIGFISGHFWIYPATLSQAWDSSLAYLNYFPKEQEMIKYIDAKGIPHEEIATSLYLNARYYTKLQPELEKEGGYARFNSDTPYFLHSNVENSTKDAQLEYLASNYTEVKTVSQLGVFLTLYKRNK